jgi:hypothetical protein
VRACQTALEINDRFFCHPGALHELRLRPIEEASSRARLSRVHDQKSVLK